MALHFRAKPIAAGMLSVLAISICSMSVGLSQNSIAPPAVSQVDTPPGTEGLRVQWVKVEAANLGVMLAAVARPPRAGPFPIVVLLHGSHGFAHEYVRLAQDLADGGLMAI